MGTGTVYVGPALGFFLSKWQLFLGFGGLFGGLFECEVYAGGGGHVDLFACDEFGDGDRGAGQELKRGPV